MIDLHCHILPGVDDGPTTMADAIAMCRLAAEDGCTVMVATPHQRHPSFEVVTRQRLATVCAELAAALATIEGPRVEVRLGAEVRVDSELLADLEREPSEVLSLAGGRYLLLELGRSEGELAPEDLVHELKVGGWRPVLAHPEMIPWLELGRVAHLVELGAMLQITASAVTNEFGRHPHQRVWQLLDEGLVHFVASDSHSPTWRAPGLAAARGAVERRLGAAVARQIFVDNPARVLADVPLHAPVAVSARVGDSGSPGERP